MMSDEPATRCPPSEIWRALLDMDAVRRLVREGLGCQCPETIFDDVVIGRPSVFAEPGALSSAQVLVGRRLLVSFVELARLADGPTEGAKRLLLEGRHVRDEHGLNRFRLVLVGECERSSVELLSTWASTVDDRLHVHALSVEALSTLLEGRGE
jgi:hypothetical protein